MSAASAVAWHACTKAATLHITMKVRFDMIGREPGFPPSGVNGTFELAINVGEPAHVDAAFARMVAGGAGAIYEPRDERIPYSVAARRQTRGRDAPSAYAPAELLELRASG